MRRFIDIAVTGSGVVVGFAAFLIGVSVTYGVLTRSVFGMTNAWVTDVNTYIMGFITFVGAGYALREEAHVGVEIVTRRLGPRTQITLRVLSDLIVLLVSATLLWLGLEFWWDAWLSGEQSWGLFSVRLWIPYTCLPVGFALLIVVQLTRTANSIRHLINRSR